MLNSLLPSVLDIRTKSASEVPLQLGRYVNLLCLVPIFKVCISLLFVLCPFPVFFFLNSWIGIRRVCSDPDYFCNANNSMIVIRVWIRRIQPKLQYVWPNVGGGEAHKQFILHC
jgi:hypothetical protein